MKEYTAQWRYHSGYGTFGKGDSVTLSDEEAAFFNRDSPGVLLLSVSAKKEPASVVGRALSGPSQHRMVTGADTKKREQTEEAPAIDATKSAIKLAAEHGIDLASVQGTGTGGRIIKTDIDKLIE